MSKEPRKDLKISAPAHYRLRLLAAELGTPLGRAADLVFVSMSHPAEFARMVAMLRKMIDRSKRGK